MDIFIDTNNTIYATIYASNRTLIWTAGSSVPTRILTQNLVNLMGVFVNREGAIFLDAAGSTGRVDKWTWNGTSGVPIMYACKQCYDLFIDDADRLYCSMGDVHQVIRKELRSASNAFTIVAGTGSAGSASDMLNRQWGIFVDINFDLYVADEKNHRVQRFPAGQRTAVTVAGSGSVNVTIILSYPTAITLDADGYLFIVDSSNHRVVASGSNGFRCMAGCSNSSGSASNQLSYPKSLSFDRDGNLFVIDEFNNRIQKFLFTGNFCSKCSLRNVK